MKDMPKIPIFPIFQFLLTCMFDAHMLNLAKWRRVLQNGRGCLNFPWARRECTAFHSPRKPAAGSALPRSVLLELCWPLEVAYRSPHGPRGSDTDWTQYAECTGGMALLSAVMVCFNFLSLCRLHHSHERRTIHPRDFWEPEASCFWPLQLSTEEHCFSHSAGAHGLGSSAEKEHYSP